MNQEKVALWNKRHFEDKETECAACLKKIQYVYLLKKYLKWDVWRVAVWLSYV
jgi:hypothetical protein